MLKRRWVWVCFRGMVEPGIPRPLRSTPYPPPPPHLQELNQQILLPMLGPCPLLP